MEAGIEILALAHIQSVPCPMIVGPAENIDAGFMLECLAEFTKLGGV
jgi:hypothetical protein